MQQSCKRESSHCFGVGQSGTGDSYGIGLFTVLIPENLVLVESLYCIFKLILEDIACIMVDTLLDDGSPILEKG